MSKPLKKSVLKEKQPVPALKKAAAPAAKAQPVKKAAPVPKQPARKPVPTAASKKPTPDKVTKAPEKKIAAAKPAPRPPAKPVAAPKKPKSPKVLLNPNMISCYRCYKPFEPLNSEKLCADCEKLAQQVFHRYFGDEDPYSPQPSMRISKIARVIPRKIHTTPQQAPEPAAT